MSVHDGTEDDAGERQPVRNALDERARRPERRARDVVARRAVDRDGDDKVHERDERLADDDGLGVVARVAHLGGDREAVSSARSATATTVELILPQREGRTSSTCP